MRTPASTHPAVARVVISVAALLAAAAAAAAAAAVAAAVAAAAAAAADDDGGMTRQNGVHHFVVECHVLAEGLLLWTNETGCHVWHMGM